jgi:hypothetical protein
MGFGVVVVKSQELVSSLTVGVAVKLFDLSFALFTKSWLSF